jgi:hypothetical protein
MAISKKSDTKYEPQNWIWCLKEMHHHYFVRTKLPRFLQLSEQTDSSETPVAWDK